MSPLAAFGANVIGTAKIEGGSMARESKYPAGFSFFQNGGDFPVGRGGRFDRCQTKNHD
jgi:hypothetical protein